MSITRTPLRNDAIRRSEDIADARRVAAIVGGIMVLAAFAIVVWCTWGGR